MFQPNLQILVLSHLQAQEGLSSLDEVKRQTYILNDLELRKIDIINAFRFVMAYYGVYS